MTLPLSSRARKREGDTPSSSTSTAAAFNDDDENSACTRLSSSLNDLA
jgi:hypothetical protein